MSPLSHSTDVLKSRDRRSIAFRLLARILSTGGVFWGAIAFLPMGLGVSSLLFVNWDTEQFHYIAAVGLGYVVVFGYIGRSLTAIRPSMAEVLWAKATWLLSSLVQGWFAVQVLSGLLAERGVRALTSGSAADLVVESWWLLTFFVSLCGLFFDFTVELLDRKRAEHTRL